MTSESDSTSHRRPPTIDLTAKEVAPERPAGPEAPSEETSAPSPSAESAAGSSHSHIASALAGGVAGAIAIAAIIVALQATGHWPLGESPAPPAAVVPAASNDAAIADVTAQLNKIQGALAAQQPDPTLVNRLASAEAATKSLNNSVAALGTRLDQIAGAAQAAQVQAKSAVDTADTAKSTAQGGVAHGDIDALTGRIAALESTVKSLSDKVTRPNASADDGAARLMIATEALRAAVERGAPYQVELAAAKSLGADQKATAPLEPFAVSGVPSATALARDLASLTPALMKVAEPAASDDSFLGRLEVNAQRLVRSTPLNAPAGDDPRSVAMRISFDASHDDIDAALADIAKLPDAAKGVAAPWMQKAQARATAITASRQLVANALAALSKPQ
jgi:hypothetical protein